MFADPYVAGDWAALCARLDGAHTLDRWAHREPALAGLGSPRDLAAVLAPGSGTSPERADALLGALVRRGSRDGGDDPDAVLLVVHLLADGVHAYAARLADLYPDPVGLLVGELAAQVRAWPLRRTRAYAANLLRDSRAACLHELLPRRAAAGRERRELPVDPLDEHVIRRVFGASPLPAPDELPGFELDDVIAWACRRGIATTAELRQLVAVERHRGDGAAARAGLAARFGVHERTLRRHRDRALAALRAAADDYAAEDDAVSVRRPRARRDWAVA